MRLDVGDEITADGANITIDAGGEIDSFDAATSQYLSIQSTLMSITTSGHLTLDKDDFVWVPLVVDGELTLSDLATLHDSLLTVEADGKVDGTGTLEGDIANLGTIVAQAYSDGGVTTALKIAGTVTGSGQLEVGEGFIGERLAEADGGPETFASLELSGPDSGNVSFADGTGELQLDDPSGFTGTITPSGVAPDGFFYLVYGQVEEHGPLGDTIVLGGVSLASVSSWNYVSQGDAGTLTIDTGAATYALNFVGEFSNASFTLSAGSQVFSNSTPGLDIQVTVPPAVVSLTSDQPAGGSLTTGGDVVFSLTTTDLVVATNAALTLSNGATAVYTSDFLNPTATDDLQFVYTVAAADANTADLKVTGFTGSIVDPSGQALNPAAVVEDTGLAVDKAAPPARDFSGVWQLLPNFRASHLRNGRSWRHFDGDDRRQTRWGDDGCDGRLLDFHADYAARRWRP